MRRRYKRLHAEDYVDNEASVLVRAGEKLAAENKILRKENEGLRSAIFEEKRKTKREKALNFNNGDEQEGQALFFSPAKVTSVLNNSINSRWRLHLELIDTKRGRG